MSYSDMTLTFERSSEEVKLDPYLYRNKNSMEMFISFCDNSSTLAKLWNKFLHFMPVNQMSRSFGEIKLISFRDYLVIKLTWFWTLKVWRHCSVAYIYLVCIFLCHSVNYFSIIHCSFSNVFVYHTLMHLI